MKQTEIFMNALVKVAKFVYPNIVIDSKRTERIEQNGGVYMTYEINGYDEEKMVEVTILSTGFVLGDNYYGKQIEIIENGVTRYFPFFGFNWVYLME